MTRLSIIRALVGACLLLAASASAGRADEPASPDGRAGEVRALLASPQGAAILELLGDPGVRAALHPPARIAVNPDEPDDLMLGHRLEHMLRNIRARLLGLVAELARMPGELATCWERLRATLPGSRVLPLVGYLAAFLLGGFGVQRLFYRLSVPWRDHFNRAELLRLDQRVTILAERFLFGVLMLASFAAGSLGAFLLFSWPPAIGSVILAYLSAFLLVRLAVTLCRFFLAPAAERLRLVPVDTPTALFWQRAASRLTGVAAIGGATVQVLGSFGMSDGGTDLLWHVVLLALLASSIAIVWRQPEAVSGDAPHPRRPVMRILGSLGLVFVWLLFLMGEREIGWSLLILAALPVALRVLLRATARVVRGHWPAPGEDAPAISVIAERAVLAIVAVAGGYALTHVWHISFDAVTSVDTAMTRIGRGAFEALVILLGADLLWQVVRVLIDRRLTGEVTPIDALGDAELRRRARLRTLLPVLRNFVFFLVMVMASLSALAAMGLQIGPLLAGAGVVGIGVGFGAQTLVRDILSGIFFLLDDAFRVGEVIESGGISGTVESFSLRSVKLRHFKGQLHTVPFGDLKAITNYSRDWVSEQMPLVVTYDSDLEAVEDAIAAASEALRDNAVLAPSIIEPLVSMGVTAMVNAGMQIGVSVKTRPGAQFAVRAAALRLLRREFAQRGVSFASWIVPAPGVPPPPLVPRQAVAAPSTGSATPET